MPRLKQNEIRQKVTTYFKAQLDQYLDYLDRRGLSKNALADAREEMLDHDSLVDLNSTFPKYLPIARFKRLMDVPDETWDASLPQIAMELRKGRSAMLRDVLSAAERLDDYSFVDVTKTTPLGSEGRSVTLGDAVSDFMAEHAPQWSGPMQKKTQSYLAVLLEHFGPDRRLSEITRQDAAEMKKVLSALPANRSTKPETRDLSLTEAIAVPNIKKITGQTASNYIDTFRRFWDWAERHGHAPIALFDRMKIAKAKQATEPRRSYTKEETAIIYKELTENRIGLASNEDYKWGALLALYTGARLREIAQLDKEDIRREDDIWYIDINGDGKNKSLKTVAAKRRVPIHSEVIRLGFIDWVATKRDGQRLFMSLTYNVKEGYGRNLGRWFNTRLLPDLKLKESGLVFHSLRHTMVERLAKADVPEPLYQEIVGHERQGVTQQVYNK